MADIVGPFDGKPWSQDEFLRHMGAALPSGVHGSPAASSSAGDLALTLSGLNWSIGTGAATVRGAGFTRTTSAGDVTAVNTHGSWSRRDRLVLRRDVAAKTVTPVRIQGTPAASPVAPAIQQNETGQWDLRLFSYLVPPNSGTALTGVVDERPWIRQPISATLRNIGGTNLPFNTWTLIPFTLEDVDTGGGHDNGDPTRWYAPVSKTYVVSAVGSFTPSTTSLSYRGVRVRKNGTVIAGDAAVVPVAANGRLSVSTPAVPVWMNVGDYLEVQAYHNAADAVTTYSDAEYATALHVMAATPGW